jgi:hypothetical protein
MAGGARWAAYSVNNSSGPSFLFRVWDGTEPMANWRAGLSIDLNRQLGYGTMEIQNSSELGGLSGGCPAGPFADTYNALDFAT